MANATARNLSTKGIAVRRRISLGDRTNVDIGNRSAHPLGHLGPFRSFDVPRPAGHIATPSSIWLGPHSPFDRVSPKELIGLCRASPPSQSMI
jgi:hypothetical protein